MLHPYSIMFKAMWEAPPSNRDDAVEGDDRSIRRLRDPLRRSYARVRRALGWIATDDAHTPAIAPGATEAPRGGTIT